MYDLEHLGLTEKQHSIYEFYKKYDFKQFEITPSVRDEWSKVIQGLDNHNIKFRNNKYRHELVLPRWNRNEVQTGIINMISVISHLFWYGTSIYDKYTCLMNKNNISKETIIIILHEFLNSIANPNINISCICKLVEEFESKGRSDFAAYRIIDVLKRSIATKMELEILKRHANIKFISRSVSKEC